MDFEVHYTDQQDNFRTHVRQWLEDNVPQELRNASEHDESEEAYRQRRELGRNLAREGWLYPMAPPWMAAGDGLLPPVARISSRGLKSLGIERTTMVFGGLANKTAATPALIEAVHWCSASVGPLSSR